MTVPIGNSPLIYHTRHAIAGGIQVLTWERRWEAASDDTPRHGANPIGPPREMSFASNSTDAERIRFGIPLKPLHELNEVELDGWLNRCRPQQSHWADEVLRHYRGKDRKHVDFVPGSGLWMPKGGVWVALMGGEWRVLTTGSDVWWLWLRERHTGYCRERAAGDVSAVKLWRHFADTNEAFAVAAWLNEAKAIRTTPAELDQLIIDEANRRIQKLGDVGPDEARECLHDALSMYGHGQEMTPLSIVKVSGGDGWTHRIIRASEAKRESKPRVPTSPGVYLVGSRELLTGKIIEWSVMELTISGRWWLHRTGMSSAIVELSPCQQEFVPVAGLNVAWAEASRRNKQSNDLNPLAPHAMVQR